MPSGDGAVRGVVDDVLAVSREVDGCLALLVAHRDSAARRALHALEFGGYGIVSVWHGRCWRCGHRCGLVLGPPVGWATVAWVLSCDVDPCGRRHRLPRIYRRPGRRSSSRVSMRVKRSETLVSKVDRRSDGWVSAAPMRSRLAPTMNQPNTTVMSVNPWPVAVTGMGQEGAGGGMGAGDRVHGIRCSLARRLASKSARGIVWAASSLSRDFARESTSQWPRVSWC